MQIEIVRVYMGWNKVIKRASIPKYPKEPIDCGLQYKALSGNLKEFKFYGGVNDSKGKAIWEFEIHVEFTVDKLLVSKHNSDEIEFEKFATSAYEKVKSEFERANEKDKLLNIYSLSDSYTFGITPAFF